MPQVCLRPSQPSWAPRCVAFRGRCALITLPACSGHPGFYVGNEGFPVRCAPNGPARYLWILGRFQFETFLRLACLEWLCQTPCSHAGYLGVSTLHTIKNQQIFGFVIDRPRASQLQLRYHRRLLHSTHLSRSYQAPSDTGHHRLETSLGSECLQRPP
jgi:hypothetical protein